MPRTAAHEIDELIARELDALTALRRDLHRHPQLAYEETYASRQVQGRLDALGVAYEAGFAETGVVGWIEPTDPAARDRPAVGLRADMDALPITEETGVAYASEHEGVMHACGHDGHTTILLGAATVLAQLRDRLTRPVKLIFQPAEEGQAGASRLMDAGVLSARVGGHAVERLFGLHGWPWLELGSVGCKPGAVMASMDDFHITVTGRGGHGATPHRTVDPVVAAAHVVTALQSIVSRNVDPTDAAVVTVATIHAGQAHNIIPDTAELTGTLRALDDATGEQVRQRVRDVAAHVIRAMGCEAAIDVRECYPVTWNEPACAAHVQAIARAVLGDARAVRMERATMAAEDFAFYGRNHDPEHGVASAFFFLGLKPADADDYPGLHTSRFDFNDAAIPVGVRMMCELAMSESEDETR